MRLESVFWERELLVYVYCFIVGRGKGEGRGSSWKDIKILYFEIKEKNFIK